MTVGKCLFTIGIIGAAMGATNSVHAAAIDNPGDAVFVFYDNPGAPFLEFANNDEVSCYNPTGPGSEFEAFVTGAGVMGYTSHSMVYHVTSVAFGGDDVYVQLDVDDLVGTTNLSGTDPDIDWTLTARLRFRHGPNGGGDFDQTTCSTDYFDIDITGDWGNTTSSPYTIPALDGTTAQNCDGNYFILNFLFDLGTSGALLHLYKFTAYNVSTMDPLEGS